MKIRFLENTNIRKSHLDLSIPPVGIIFNGVEMEVEDRIFNGESISGIATYFKDKHGWYYWSGKIAILYRALSAPGVLTDEKYQEAGELVANWEFATNASEKKEAVSRSAHDMDEQIEYEDIVFEEKTEESIQDSIISVPPAEAAVPTPNTDTRPIVPEKFSIRPEKILTTLQLMDIPRFFWEEQQLIGENVNVAILDTGFNLQHPDLKEAVKAYRNFTSTVHNSIVDEDGHGTINSLLIAGRGHQEYYGVAPKSNLLVAKVASKVQQTTFQACWDALHWAIEEQAQVVFMNFAFSEQQLNQSEKEKWKQFLTTHYQKGIVFVAPVGDSLFLTPENRYPAAFGSCLSVGAHDANGRRLAQSARSYQLDVLAPLAQEYLPKIKWITGHSAAFTAGLVALLVEFCLKNDQQHRLPGLISLLQSTTQPHFTKHNLESGYGLLNAQHALQALIQQQARS